MWQNKNLSTLLALGLVAVVTSTGCATSVEEPVDIGDEEASADMTAESSEALTAGGWGGYRGGRYARGGRFAYGPRGRAWGLRRGYGAYAHPGYGLPDYGLPGHGLPDYGLPGYGPDYFDHDIGGNVIVDVDVVVAAGGLPDYPGYIDEYPDILPGYGGCGDYDDDYFDRWD